MPEYSIRLLNPDTVRPFLAAIATSVMTVAGVTFSVTLLAEAHISSQVGPRVLSGFLDDQDNQITLGVLVSTFLFSLLTLLQINSSAFGESSKINYFVPSISVFAVLFLTVVSIFSFISFIHHMSDTIRTSSSIAKVGEKTVSIAHDFFSNSFIYLNSDQSESMKHDAKKYSQQADVFLRRVGYVQSIDFENLASVLNEHKMFIGFKSSIGDFSSKNEPFAYVYSNHEIQESAVEKVCDTISVGKIKTLNDNYYLGCSLLVEIAARAMSPGINDPVTFKECANQLVHIMHVLSGYEADNYFLKDSNERIVGRLAIKNISVVESDFYKQLKYYAKDDPIASEHLNNILAIRKGYSTNHKV